MRTAPSPESKAYISPEVESLLLLAGAQYEWINGHLAYLLRMYRGDTVIDQIVDQDLMDNVPIMTKVVRTMIHILEIYIAR